LAALAGISAGYYASLEQGRHTRVSGQILDDLAQALQLDRRERALLGDLADAAGNAASAETAGGAEVADAGPASPPRGRRLRVPREPVRPGLRRLVDSLGGSPAVLLGRHGDVLAWNPLAAALFSRLGRVAAERRNGALLMFRDDEVRALFGAQWECAARTVLGAFRACALRDPEDPRLASIVGELSLNSNEFRTWWAEPSVRAAAFGAHTYHHPVVGELTLAYEAVRPPQDRGLLLVVLTAEAGTPSADALQLLGIVGARRTEEAVCPQPFDGR
ncbi:MAG: helix-turn-helix domain-containing protein, partial [Streptomycetaceae bacterium]|nr:helix-turn-helix domain-containing protein [Streptomycetaceae bacterium]